MRTAAGVILTRAALVSGAAAQEPYPTRPISIVNPFPPGGIDDLTGRPLAATFERLLKQLVVIVNKAGAAAAVGAQFASVAKPDGYTLLIALVSIASTPEVDTLFGRHATYTRDQFVGIARLNADPPVLVVNGPWTTLKDLVDNAKKRAGEITFASSGPYGASHLPLEMFRRAAGLKMRHLPTIGGGPATTAVLGGHALLWASPPALAAPHIAVGKMRALATWGAARLAAFPDVPTLKELGYDVEYYIWTGLFAPRGIPPGVLQWLRDTTRRAAQDDELTAFWDADATRIASVIQCIGKTEAK